MQEETRNILTVQLRSGNCTSVLIIWIPAFIKMSSLLCSVPFVNTSFPICPCWDYGCYKLNSWHQHWQPRANLWNSAGEILTTSDTKQCPSPSHPALCPSGASSAPFGQAAAGNAACQRSQLQQTSNAPTPSISSLPHTPPSFPSGRWAAAAQLSFVPWQHRPDTKTAHLECRQHYGLCWEQTSSSSLP